MAIAKANHQARPAPQHRGLVAVCRLVHGDPATSRATTSSPRLIRITPLPHEPRHGWSSNHRRLARHDCPNLRAAAARPIAGHPALAGPHLRRGQPPRSPAGASGRRGLSIGSAAVAAPHPTATRSRSGLPGRRRLAETSAGVMAPPAQRTAAMSAGDAPTSESTSSAPSRDASRGCTTGPRITPDEHRPTRPPLRCPHPTTAR